MIYQNHEVVRVDFSYSEELVKLVKSLPGARWDKLYRTWYIEKRAGLLNEVLNCFKGKAYLDYKSIKNEAMLTATPVVNIASKKKLPVVEKPKKNKVKQYSLALC